MAAAYLFDGFPTLVSIGGAFLYERTVDPPGFTGGGAIEVSTMRNDVWRTQWHKSLVTVSQSGMKAAYDPTTLFTIIDTLILVNEVMIFTWPTTQHMTFMGWIEDFKPEALEEGKLPLADVKIEASNLLNGVETGPVLS